MNSSETIGGITMISIPGGSFMMGHVYKYDPSLPDTVNAYYPDEQPVHRVTLKPFQMGRTPVTQGKYMGTAGINPSTFKGDDNLPVTNIGPSEIITFCNKASLAAGLEPCYNEKTRECDFTKSGFRMPTEAEWEYSCRAETITLFYSGNTEKDLARAGWYIGNSGGRTHPVAQKEPNAWGLYDMHGNVFEYCNDDWIPAMCFGKYLLEHEQVPTFHYYHSLNMTRGGSWFSEPSVCRSAARSCFCSWADINQSWYMGFRVARSLK